ncbi:MAG: 4-hydroxy-3-methylbut-2-enyl diphosphate reductase, partial [Clostridia bacterium]|nr:4-hydroxy-3-methylbut-2-enyl diphosphate reductase [Clostridia bacterium]
MKISVAESAGFCFGVERAVKLLEKAIEDHGADIYTIGPIIHNPQIIRQMSERGVK